MIDLYFVSLFLLFNSSFIFPEENGVARYYAAISAADFDAGTRRVGRRGRVVSSG